MSGDVDIHHLGAAYALDALDDHERAAFEAHYPSCEVCHADVIEFRATLATLAEATATAPPTALRDRVLGEIAQTRQLSPLLPATVTDLAERHRRRQRTIGGLLAAAAVVLAFVAGALVTNRDAAPDYADDLAAVLGAADARFVSLTAASGSAGAVKVAWSDTMGSAVMLGDGLAPAPDGQAYELWLIGADGPVPMSVLATAAGGEIRHVVALDGAAEPAAWGVTLEPVGGSPSPTGAILYSAEA